MSNPYGSSCGTSITVAPRKGVVTRRGFGSPGCRLSDTRKGTSTMVHARSKDEQESMDRHPAGKGKVYKIPMSETIDLSQLMGIAERQKQHNVVEQNRRDEDLSTRRLKDERAEHLRLVEGEN